MQQGEVVAPDKLPLEVVKLLKRLPLPQRAARIGDLGSPASAFCCSSSARSINHALDSHR